jgi:hypothetical protein
MKQDRVTSDKVAAVSSPDVRNITDVIGLSLNINGQETFQFGMSGISSNTTGGIITSVKLH